MSNGDENGDQFTRKSHIKRIYKDDDPDTNPDQWIDVERIDEILFVSKRQFPWREKRWTFDWDRFDPDGENVTIKMIENPQDTSNRTEDGRSKEDGTFVEVPVRDMIFVTTGKEQQFQAYRHFFLNDNRNTTRETHSRRVYHYEMSDDKLDDDKNPPRDPQDYSNALGNKDKDQYVEVEILDEYWTNERESRDVHGNVIVGNSGIWQEKKWLLGDLDPLLRDRDGDTSKDGTTVNPSSDESGAVVTVDPPWRLDPLQNIVNVSWGGGSVAVAANYREGFGGEHNSIYRLRMRRSEKDPKWEEVEKYTSSPEEGIWVGFEVGIGCAVYASVGADERGKGGKSTFVIGGAWGVSAGDPARISISNDGQKWFDTYTGPGEGVIYGVCWDEKEKAFYAAMQDNQESEAFGSDANLYDVLLKSSDGNNWSQVYRAQIGGFEGGQHPEPGIHPPPFVLPAGYTNPIVNHGGDKVKDSDGVNVTNAFWGYNKANKTLIYPNPPYNYWSGGSGATQLRIERETEDDEGNKVTEKTTKSLQGMAIVWAVTFAGGIWHACGQSVGVDGQGGVGYIATSTDDGKTWKTTQTTPAGNPIASIASGPTTDFSDQNK